MATTAYPFKIPNKVRSRHVFAQRRQSRYSLMSLTANNEMMLDNTYSLYSQ